MAKKELKKDELKKVSGGVNVQIDGSANVQIDGSANLSIDQNVTPAVGTIDFSVKTTNNDVL